MNMVRINKYLVLYTLLVFLGGVFAAGVWLVAGGYDIPWLGAQNALAETASPGSTGVNLFASDVIQHTVEQAGPAVVKIETASKSSGAQNLQPFLNDPFFREFFGNGFQGTEPRVTQGLGSGFIISKDGYILTNNHVIEGADEVKVYLTTRQEPYEAKVVGADAELDLAVLKIQAGSDLPILKLGDSNEAKVGSWVIAIGNPYGLDHTVTVGVISAKGRPVVVNNTEYKDLIQTDASINPGNSGGPLLNLNGEVIGINTAINAEAQGIGFAISSSTVQQVLDQLLEKGKVVRPWLGVYMQPVTDELAKYFGLEKAKGALIGAVQDDSPAQKAGLQRGDIILEYNKTAIEEPADLQNAVRNSKVGDKAVLLVHRNGKTQYITVIIAESK